MVIRSMIARTRLRSFAAAALAVPGTPRARAVEAAAAAPRTARRDGRGGLCMTDSFRQEEAGHAEGGLKETFKETRLAGKLLSVNEAGTLRHHGGRHREDRRPALRLDAPDRLVPVRGGRHPLTA